MNLNFNIQNQMMTRTDNSYLVNLTRNYITCTFNFLTDDWTGLDKYITFNSKNENYRFLFNDGSALAVPNDLLKRKYFHVKAYGLDMEDDLTLTTNDVTIVLDTVDNDPLLSVSTNKEMEDIINWLSSVVNRKVDRFEVKGRRVLCYKNDDIIQIIPINDECVMNLLNEPFIDVNTEKLTEDGLLFYRRHNL